MNFTEEMRQRARDAKKVLVLPEGTEERTIKAARIIMDERIASKVCLIGSRDEIARKAKDLSVNIEGIELIDTADSNLTEGYAKEFFELRKHKGVTMEEAIHAMKNNLRFGAMMVRMGDASSMVAGAENSTGNVLLAGFQIIGTSPGTKYASSAFVMAMQNKSFGKDGLMIFSDCATIPDPTAEQLAEIAIQASESCRAYLKTEPVVAMLSFSTKGSAKHENVDKVLQALEIVKTRKPDLLIDGEMQLDAAVIPEVGSKKAPGSPVAGKANTLIFPDLQSGNIGYKIAQRFGNADAYGPFLQGFAKPISDLSRGCSVDDIVNTSAVTLAQS